MRGLLAVARREIEEKRFVFLAAAAASFVPFAVPLVRGLHGAAAVEVRDWVALIGGFAVALGLAVVLGSTVVASDLAERRIGFYFSRPITGLALWAGKLGAACLIALVAGAIVYVPTLAANGGSVAVVDLQASSPSPVGLLLSIVAAVFVFHAGNILLRPRSPLLAFDMSALVLLTLGVVFVLRQFAMACATEALRFAVDALTAAGVIALVLAGLVAVIRGRSDSRAAHRVLSTALWGTLSTAVAALALYVAWVLSASPRDLSQVWTTLPAGRGNWLVVHGAARGSEPVFLFEAVTGRYRKAGHDWRLPVLSPDGTRAVWFEPSGPTGPFEAMTWKLDEPVSGPVRTTLSFPGAPAAFLSEHGERLATISDGLLSIYDLASGASLGSARVDEKRSYMRGFFLDRDHFRLFRPNHWRGPSDRGRLDILEFEVSSKTLSTTGSIEDAQDFGLRATASGDRLLVRETGRLGLRDGRSGALLVSLLEKVPGAKVPGGRFLSDGRIVVAVASKPNVVIEVFAPDGGHERTIAIPAKDRIVMGAEPAPGKLIVAAGGPSNESLSRTIFLADISSGEVRQVADRLFPVAYFAGFTSDAPDYLPAPGSEASRLFYGPQRSLVHFDALRGERRLLLGRENTP